MKYVLLSILFLFTALFFSSCAMVRNSRSSRINEQFLYAVENGYAEQMQRLLKDGADPNARDRENVPVLLRAALFQKADCLNLLLRAEADPNVTDNEGFTALHCAAAAGAVESVKALLKAGASVDPRTGSGRTPLMEAVRMGNLDCAEILNDAGADLKAKDNDGGTIASHASTAPKNGIIVLRYLHDRKIELVDPNAYFFNSPLLRSLFYGKRENAHFILSTIRDFKSDKMQAHAQIAVRLAIRDNDIDSVKMLVKKGLKLNFSLPLAFKTAEFFNSAGILKLLARENILDRGYTPLIWAAIYGRPEIAEYLILEGADPLVRSREGQTALNYANDSTTAKAIRSAVQKKQQSR